jgi:hypothetical protein
VGRTTPIAGLAAAVLVAFAAGCGGNSTPSGPELSAKAYKAKLVKISKESDEAQVKANDALQAKTVTLMRDYLTLFAAAEGKIGDQLAKLNPPSDADSANKTLAKGANDIASAATDAVAKMASLNDDDLGGALALLKQNSKGEKGGQEVTDALDQLHKLGYTTTAKPKTKAKSGTTTSGGTTTTGG